MSTTRNKNLLATALVCALAFTATGARAASSEPVESEDLDTRIGKLSFTHDFANGYPTKETVEKVYDERDFQRANPPATKVVSVGGGDSLANAPRGFAYWETLARWINEEPVQERDRIMMGMLKSLGIEKGKPFTPDARMKKILTDATLVGEAMAKVNDYEKRNMEQSVYAKGSEWMFELCLDPSQETANYTQLDERASWFYEASCTSAGMVSKTPGVGSVYLGINKDKDGDWLDGATNYRLHVPPNPPMKQFWSITLYDVDTRALIKNGTDITDRSSVQDLVKNADGSVDLYFGPKAPKGLEKNWIPTVAGKAWFPYFRLYGPTEAHFDRTWILPDIEKVK